MTLDTRCAKKDGTYPLILRVGHNARTTSIPVGVSLMEKDWDAETRAVKKSYTGTLSITRLNNLIQKKKQKPWI
jgi:integrase/recombinase XerD